MTEDPKLDYADKLRGLDDDGLVDEVNRQVWLSAFANNNPRSSAHWKVDLTHDEAKHRGKPWVYQAGFNKAYRSCGYTPTDAELERAMPPVAANIGDGSQ